MTPADSTAQLVASHQRYGLATRRRALPLEQPPIFIESEYAAALVRFVREWRAELADLVRDLPHLLAAARRDSDLQPGHGAQGDPATGEALLVTSSAATHETARPEITFVRRLGLKIAIENPAGSVREWADSDGTKGSTLMRWSYGYVVGAVGADGEDVDVYLGPIEAPEFVYVVHQRKKSSGFVDYDEDKCLVGFASADDAKAAYLAQYDEPRFFGGMTVLSAADFVEQLRKTSGGPIVFRADETTEGMRVRSAINRARTVANRTAGVARRAGQQAADHQKRQFQRQMKAGLGVEVPTLDRDVPTMIERFVERNVSRVEALEAKTLGDIERLVLDALDGRITADELAAQIAERFDIAERAARNLAGNQLNRLSAQVRRVRHLEIGIRAFRWKNSPDHIRRGVVREAHKVKHDRIFPYEGSRAPSFFPGEEPHCGCTAVPLIDDIKSKVNQLAGRGRRRIV